MTNPWETIAKLRAERASIVRVLVTGGRDFNDGDFVFRALSVAYDALHFQLLIHGGARGADTLADEWARGAGVQPCQCDALWRYYTKQGNYRVAGHKRNAAMLLLQPQLVIAFPGGNGTRDMIAQAAGLPLVDLRSNYKEPA